MTDKIQPMASSTKGVKHALETAISKFTNATIKKRKVMAEMQINQYLAPGLEDSLFGKLTEEVMFHILHRLSLNDLSQMSMASKAFGKVIYAYVTEEQFAMRVARLLIQIPISSVMLLEQSQYVGRLLKRVSFLFTVDFRLKFFHQHIQKVQRLVEKESANSLPIDTLPFVGAVLQSFIAGWDEGECLKVFTFMSDCLFLYRSISRFVCDAPGTDLDNELFLRRNLRYLFLDRCVTDYDRAIWIGFISNQIGTAQLAKVLLLLYCPINTHGQIDWSFAFNVRAFQQHTNVFFKLAKTIGILQLIPNWSPSLSLEVLVYISNVPNCWLLRSFSSVLLPLSSIDMNLVVKYFEILYKSGRASTASLLMALALMISPQFIGHNFRNEIVVDRSCVHQLISNIINAPRLTPERYVVVKKLWGAVLTLADDFAETAVQDEVHGGNNNDTIDDFHDLMDAWKDLSIILMSV
ncbi:F-box only protein 47-like isoform X1 [Daphnia magna]|uniref:F-box only protein 47-like isoform X1 n=1 Tax=Daphnia magna TaxID=35525 RepID=UPI001E1BD2D9|nr:F-box only protein 47-like isoform X1 [Daphnia magna]